MMEMEMNAELDGVSKFDNYYIHFILNFFEIFHIYLFVCFFKFVV